MKRTPLILDRQRQGTASNATPLTSRSLLPLSLALLPLSLLMVLLLAFLVWHSPPSAHAAAPLPEAPVTAIRLAADDAKAAWAPDMLTKARRALPRAEARLGLRLGAPVRLISFGSEWEFNRYLNARPTHIVAMARPQDCEIIILRPQWFALGAGGQEEVLVHEMTHLILGRRVHGRLPAWLNEGLAMVAADEGDFETSWRVGVAGAMGSLLPLELLMDEVAIGSSSQELAYAQSLSLTRFYIPRALPDRPVSPNDPAPLAQALADPETGPVLLSRLWDRNFIIAFDAQWRREHGSLWGWIMFLSGTSFLWLFISGLFLLATWRKRLLKRYSREQLELSEARDEENGCQPQPWEYEGDADEDDEDDDGLDDRDTDDTDSDEPRHPSKREHYKRRRRR